MDNNMNEQEKRLKEQRTIQATDKNLMGISGKLGTIVKYLGQPIVLQHDGAMGELMGYTSNTLDYHWLGNQDDEIPTMEIVDALGEPVQEPQSAEWGKKNAIRQAWNISHLGWHFDGLSRSMHLEIKFLEDESELTVHYNGYMVFKEVGGELMMYTPFDEWELKINTLFNSARRLKDNDRKQEKQERIESAKIAKETWLEKLKKTWGL